MGGARARRADLAIWEAGAGSAVPAQWVGPVQRAWQEIGGIEPLAVGAYGEVSEGILDLVAEAARYRAERRWRQMGCDSVEEAVGAAATEIWGRCAVGFVKEQAMLLRERLHLGGPAGSRFTNARGDGEPDDEVAARGFDRGPWQVSGGGG